MQIVRIFNNNAVLALDEEGDEVVAMGKGLGFSQRIGNLVDQNKIEKIFKENAVDIPVEELFVTLSTPEIDSLLAIIDLATTELGENIKQIFILLWLTIFILPWNDLKKGLSLPIHLLGIFDDFFRMNMLLAIRP